MYALAPTFAVVPITWPWTPARAVAAAIGLYQRFVSPYKGFRCAHRALNGRCSCSEYAKRVVNRRGVLTLIPLLRRRFTECGVAAQVLDYEARQTRRRVHENQRRSSGSGCSPSFDGTDLANCCAEAACEGLVNGGMACACDALGSVL
jgi:putative component of membrane protein insertase Oxa1/YidC/SpoIIIJ protein YidD